MKFFKQGPLFLILLSTGILFTLIAAGGKDNIYETQEYDPFKAPLLSIMFTGIREEIYPWQMFDAEAVETLAEASSEKQAEAGKESGEEQELSDAQDTSAAQETSSLQEASVSSQTLASPAKDLQPEPSAAQPTLAPSPTPAPYGEGRVEPLRESTKEEYRNHISADIYGNVGIEKAASFDFMKVDESYFDDALFIGDSRTVGLRDYTDLSEHADFYCETSLTVYKVMEEDFKGLGTIEEALLKKDYGKIYIMVGINELGRGTTEDFMSKYTEMVDALHLLAPDAKIIIQGVMRVTGKKSGDDAIFNNNNINARNNAIATLADNEHIFYIDVNEVVCDEEGNLKEDYTFDQIHLLGVYNDLWKQFLLEHGV